MKKVSQIFSIIGGVLAILCGVGLVLSSVLMLLLNVPEIKDIFMDTMQKAADASNLPLMDYANYILAGATASAIINFVFAVFCFVAAFFSFSCHKKKSYVPTIVFGVLAYCQLFVILGAIFGLIFDKKEN